MQPHLYIEIDGEFLSSPDSLPNCMECVGIIKSPRGDDGHISHIFQEFTNVPWCASSWDEIPSEDLWWARGEKGILFTHVLFTNLDFRNTPFEHRFNLYAVDLFQTRHGESGVHPELRRLAEMEAELWREHNSFVPFKEPNPQGYQGVYGDFAFLITSTNTIAYVYDEFRCGRTLLERRS